MWPLDLFCASRHVSSNTLSFVGIVCTKNRLVFGGLGAWVGEGIGEIRGLI